MTAKQQAALAPLVDELGSLQAELERIRRGQAESIKAKVKREEVLRKQIREVFAEAKPTQSFQVPGKEYVADVGPREPRRLVKSAAAVLKKLGPKRFLELVSIPIGKLEKLLAGPDFEKLVKTEPIGPRPLSVRARV